MYTYRIALLHIIMMPLFCSGSWAEITLQQLSRAEKIGQLIAARIGPTITHEELNLLLIQHKVGALIPLQYWSVAEHINIIEVVKNIPLKIPSLILSDAEWGCAMRIPELPAFPKAMTLGAIAAENPELVYEIGYAIGMQCRALGIHINCAPVVDINSNADNPVIGMRSFGDTATTVIAAASAYAQGLWDSGVLPCLKHFPGHGDTTRDSHVALPIITKTTAELWAQDIIPFNLELYTVPTALMIGHIAVPALEPEDAIIPASLSPTIIQKIVKQYLNFDGLIISDALDMGALAAYADPGEIAFRALQAGIDLLLCPSDIKAAIDRINCAIDNGEYSQAELDAQVLKILKMKEQLIVDERESGTLLYYEELIQQAYDAAANMNKSNEVNFAQYAAGEPVTVGNPKNQQFLYYLPTADEKSLVIYLYPGNYKMHRLSNAMCIALKEIAQQNPGSIVFLFGSPYCLLDIPTELITFVLYEDVPYTHITAQKILSGELMAQGKLPITI